MVKARWPIGYAASGVPIIDNVIEWYFRCHCDQTLLKVVSQFMGCHEDCVGYVLVVGLLGFARYKDLRYIIDWFLGGEFMSLFPSFSDEHNTNHLVS